MNNEFWVDQLKKYAEKHSLSFTALAKQLNEPFQVLYAAVHGIGPMSFRLKVKLSDRLGFDKTTEVLFGVLPESAQSAVKESLYKVNRDHVQRKLRPLPNSFITSLCQEGVNAAWQVLLRLSIEESKSASKLSRSVDVSSQILNRLKNHGGPFGLPLKLKLIEHLQLEISDELLYALLSEKQQGDFASVFPDLVAALKSGQQNSQKS